MTMPSQKEILAALEKQKRDAEEQIRAIKLAGPGGNIPGLVRSNRTRLGFSKEQLAERLGVTVQTIEQVETNPQNMLPSNMSRYADALDCKLEISFVPLTAEELEARGPFQIPVKEEKKAAETEAVAEGEAKVAVAAKGSKPKK